MSTFGYSKAKQVGLSLIEVLITMTLLSLTVIVLMRFQLGIFKNIKYVQYHHIALNLQTSLFEELRSCQRNIQAENEVIQKWQKIFEKHLPNSQIQVLKNRFGYQSIMINDKNQQTIILNGAV